VFLKNISNHDLAGLKDLFAAFTGGDEVYFQIIEEGKYKIIKTAFRVANNAELQAKIRQDFSSVLRLAG
jgi:uncharacterized glyoxalase superfamily metalloenzyme YdcJ